MSFFDDEDDATEEEPRRTPRPSAPTRPRGTSGRSRSGAGGPPRRGGGPQDAAVERRRLIAIGVLVVVVILMILLISSCQASSTRNSLENYNNSVSQLINRSDTTGKQVFKTLSGGGGGQSIGSSLATQVQQANQEVSDAQSLSVPGQMTSAQSKVVLALQMRADGISMIATNAPLVGNTGSASNAAIDKIADAMARFYASDVTYMDYATTEIAQALHGDNISPGGNSNIQIASGQFLPDLGWLGQNYIATELGTTYSSAATGGASSGSAAGQNSTAPGLHGDGINGVSVGSTTLTAGVTATVAASPAPTFEVSVLNGGQFNQYGIICTVSVEGGPSGKTTISEIAAGATETCNVPLSGTIQTGTFQVTVNISKVPGETNLANNTGTYTVDFQ